MFCKWFVVIQNYKLVSSMCELLSFGVKNETSVRFVTDFCHWLLGQPSYKSLTFRGVSFCTEEITSDTRIWLFSSDFFESETVN
jgi:hypothetical protein